MNEPKERDPIAGEREMSGIVYARSVDIFVSVGLCAALASIELHEILRRLLSSTRFPASRRAGGLPIPSARIYSGTVAGARQATGRAAGSSDHLTVSHLAPTIFYSPALFPYSDPLFHFDPPYTSSRGASSPQNHPLPGCIRASYSHRRTGTNTDAQWGREPPFLVLADFRGRGPGRVSLLVRRIRTVVVARLSSTTDSLIVISVTSFRSNYQHLSRQCYFDNRHRSCRPRFSVEVVRRRMCARCVVMHEGTVRLINVHGVLPIVTWWSGGERGIRRTMNGDARRTTQSLATHCCRAVRSAPWHEAIYNTCESKPATINCL